jgi:YVTN family beta-propeller protein
MSKKTIKIFTLIFCLTLCLQFIVLSQEPVSGAIHGIVQDKMMKGIEDVQVTIMGENKTCYTDETGFFDFNDLEPGNYTLCFFMHYYQTVQKNITLQKGQARGVIIEMHPIITDMPAIKGTTKKVTPVGLNPDLSNPMESADVYLLYVACAGSLSEEEFYNSNDITFPYLPVSKKKNVLMVINSLSGSAVDIIEWHDNVMPLRLAIKDRKILYIADSANNITVMDTERNNSVITVIPLEKKRNGYLIEDIATGNEGKNLYCGCSNLKKPVVKVIDTTRNIYVKTISLPALKDNSIGQPLSIVTHGQMAYVSLATSENGEVVFINTAVNTVEATVPVEKNPQGLVITPDGKKLYVANMYSKSISIIDTFKKEVSDTLNLDFKPARLTITPDGSKILVARMGSNSVSIIDTDTDSLVTTRLTGREPGCIAISGDGKFAFVGNSGSDDITIIDMAKNITTSSTRPFYGGTPLSIVVK